METEFNALMELISFVKDAVPAVWEILLRQVYAQAGLNALMFLVWFAVVMYLRKHTIRYYRAERSPTQDVILFSLAISLFICLAASIDTAIRSISYLLNPQYYALRFMLQYLP